MDGMMNIHMLYGIIDNRDPFIQSVRILASQAGDESSKLSWVTKIKYQFRITMDFRLFILYR